MCCAIRVDEAGADTVVSVVVRQCDSAVREQSQTKAYEQFQTKAHVSCWGHTKQVEGSFAGSKRESKLVPERVGVF